MTRWTRLGALVAVATVMAGTSAVAQNRAPFPERQPPDQPEQIQPRPPRAEVPRPAPANPPAGVIRPPATQDKGVIAPPNEGKAKMPEIRPPGTPGGDPDIQPR